MFHTTLTCSISLVFGNMILIIFCSSIIVTLLWIYLTKKPPNFPPGPPAYPIVGNFFTLRNKPHLALQRLSKKYGEIVGFKYGLDFGICIHGTALIKQAHNEPAFQGKTSRENISFTRGGKNGIIGSNGATWSEQRHFALRHLKDFGFGKNTMEKLVMADVNQLIDWLKRKGGKSVSLQHPLSLAVLNSLWTILTGDRFDLDDHKLSKILADLQRIPNLIRPKNPFKDFVMLFYPSIAKLFPKWSGWNHLEALRTARLALYDEIINEHKITLQEDLARDFIDVYLQTIRSTTNVASTFHPKTGEESLKSVLADLFFAGSDTQALSLAWLILCLLKYPRVQMKLHQELDRVIGPGPRPASLDDRKQCVYTEAVILETLRLSSILAVQRHCSTEDINFQGYTIRKGTLIYTNFYASHHDPKVWGDDVEEFRPERFLNSDESTIIRHESFFPFSTGRRVCLGEKLAMNNLFLFAANLVRNFEIITSEGQGKISLAFQTILETPLNLNVVMKERK